MLQHIVLMKFADDTPEGHLETFRDKMVSLLKALPEIESLHFGIDELQGKSSWHVSLLMTFHSVEDLHTYQIHPKHLVIAEFNKPYLQEIASVDCTL